MKAIEKIYQAEQEALKLKADAIAKVEALQKELKSEVEA